MQTWVLLHCIGARQHWLRYVIGTDAINTTVESGASCMTIT